MERPWPIRLRLLEPASAAKPNFHALGPVADLRDGIVRLHLPPGFQYRSFHDTDGPPVLIDGGATVLPGRHDGMAAFPASGGNVWLVRNHELNGTVAAATGVGTPYDSRAPAMVTSVLVTPFGEVLNAFTSLNGTQNNCAGGAMPWGTWITCEETVNGPDVGPDFTGAPNVNLQRRHGFIFEVPAGGQSNRQPITSAGRFPHEGAAWNQKEGALYLTEDNFAFPSGFYRYFPPTDPMKTGSLANGGRLQMLRVVGQTERPSRSQPGERRDVPRRLGRHRRPEPDVPVHAGRARADDERRSSQSTSATKVGRKAPRTSRASRAQRSRRRGSTSRRPRAAAPPRRAPSSILGYGNGTGQIWAYDPKEQTLECVFQSPSAAVLDLPDNITHSHRGTLVVCEDGPDRQLRARIAEARRAVRHRPEPAPSGTRRRNATRFGEEFAGATFSPNGHTLFVNIQAAQAISFAIWGPWGRIGV